MRRRPQRDTRGQRRRAGVVREGEYGGRQDAGGRGVGESARVMLRGRQIGSERFEIPENLRRASEDPSGDLGEGDRWQRNAPAARRRPAEF